MSLNEPYVTYGPDKGNVPVHMDYGVIFKASAYMKPVLFIYLLEQNRHYPPHELLTILLGYAILQFEQALEALLDYCLRHLIRK